MDKRCYFIMMDGIERGTSFVLLNAFGCIIPKTETETSLEADLLTKRMKWSDSNHFSYYQKVIILYFDMLFYAEQKNYCIRECSYCAVYYNQ